MQATGWKVERLAMPNGELRRGARLPYVGLEPVGGYITKSVTHGQCSVRPTVTFAASERHCPLTGTKSYCLVTEAHRCK